MKYEKVLESRNEKLEKQIEDLEDQNEILNCKLDVAETLLNLREEQLYYITSLSNTEIGHEWIVDSIKSYLENIQDFHKKVESEYRFRSDENE